MQVKHLSSFGTVNVKLDKHIFCIYIMAQQDKQEEEQDDWLKTRKSDKHFHCKSICQQTCNNSNYFLIIRHKQKHTFEETQRLCRFSIPLKCIWEVDIKHFWKVGMSCCTPSKNILKSILLLIKTLLCLQHLWAHNNCKITAIRSLKTVEKLTRNNNQLLSFVHSYESCIKFIK